MDKKKYVGVVVKCKDEVLLCKRNHYGSFPGMWSIPAGKLEDNESTHECAVREFYEETSLMISEDKLNFIGLIPRHTRDGKKVKGLMYVYQINVDKRLEPDRVGQGTRHPNTVTLNGGATFSIVLRDAAGIEVRVSSSAQGEAVNRPYQRTGDGTGTGWQNELRTIRLRLRDFQSGGTGINLAQIVAVRIEVGGTAGSATGRFILDDLQFTKE